MSEHEHILPIRTYLAVYVALMVLLVATVGAAYIDLGPVQLRAHDGDRRRQGGPDPPDLHARPLQRPAHLGLLRPRRSSGWRILIALTLNDYFTRGWLNIPGK